MQTTNQLTYSIVQLNQDEINKFRTELEDFIILINAVFKVPVSSYRGRSIIKQCKQNRELLTKISQQIPSDHPEIQWFKDKIQELNTIIKDYDSQISDFDIPIHVNQNKKTSGPFSKAGDKRKRTRTSYVDSLSSSEYASHRTRHMEKKERKKQRRKNSGKRDKRGY
mgnify:CR=1 FL=1